MGLLDDPDLSLNLGLGLIQAGQKNLAGQGGIGTGLLNGMQNYYGQKKAKQDLQIGDYDLQAKKLQNQKTMQLLDMVGGLMGPPAQGGSPQGGLMGGAPGGSASGTMAPPPGAGSPPAPPVQGANAPGASPMGGQNGAPSWLQPPTQAQLSASPVGGMNPRQLQGYNLLAGKDPVQSQKEIEQQQLEQAKRQNLPILTRLDTLVHSDKPTQYVNADKELKSAWESLAPQMGFDPDKDFNDQNLRTAFTFAHNGLASSIGAPTIAPIVPEETTRLADGRLAQTNKLTGKMDVMAAGPDIISAEDRQKNALEQAKFQFEKDTKNIPAGYEHDPNSDDPGALRFKPGGPADPMAAGGGLGARNEVMFQRVASSAQAATRAMRNIAELPITASSGWLGSYQPSTGLLGATKNVLAQKITPQDAQDYKTMLAGVSRNLATVETAGLAPGGSLTHSLEALTLNEGDTQMTKLRKMAEMRQIIEENMGPQLANPKLPPSQKELVNQIIQNAQEAVPFTQSDITRLQQSKNPKQTIMNFATSQGLGTKAPPVAPAGPPADLKSAAAAELKRRGIGQ
jgi:hypothetical protein